MELSFSLFSPTSLGLIPATSSGSSRFLLRFDISEIFDLGGGERLQLNTGTQSTLGSGKLVGEQLHPTGSRSHFPPHYLNAQHIHTRSRFLMYSNSPRIAILKWTLDVFPYQHTSLFLMAGSTLLVGI